MWPARRQRDIVWAPSGACEQTVNGLKVKMGLSGESSKICHQRMVASAIGSRHQHLIMQPGKREKTSSGLYPSCYGPDLWTTQHESTPDFSCEVNTNSSWAASIVKIGEPKTFLSVIIPFSQGQDVADLLEQLATNLAADGKTSVKLERQLLRFP